MLGCRIGRPYSSGRRRKRGGSCMQVSSPLVGTRRWRWWTCFHQRRRTQPPKSAKYKSAKKGKGAAIGAHEACLEIVPYKEDLPLIGNLVLKSTPPSSARTRSIRRSVVAKSRPSLPRQPSNALPCSKTHGSKRKTSPPISSAASETRACYL